MITWIDKPTHVLVEFVEIFPLDSCCTDESWWDLTDWRAGRRMFRVRGPLEFVPELEPFLFADDPATTAMVEAWARFCAHHAPPTTWQVERVLTGAK